MKKDEHEAKLCSGVRQVRDQQRLRKDAGYLGTPEEVAGGGAWGPRWTPHFCGALCSVTVPNETPRSCGSALLICDSGRFLGERELTQPVPRGLFRRLQLLVAYWLRRPALQCFSVSAAVTFFFLLFFSSVSSAETIYHFFGRILQTTGWMKEAAWNKKVIWVLGAIWSELWLTGIHSVPTTLYAPRNLICFCYQVCVEVWAQ